MAFAAIMPTHASDLPLVLKIEDFTNPCGIDVAPNGDIYVADTGANVIKKYNINGELKATYGDGLNLRNPEGVAVSAEGTIYIADTGNNRILKLKPDGSLNTSFGAKNGILSDNFNLPREVRIDKDRNILVVDSANHRVKRYNSNGTAVKFATGVNYLGNPGGYSPTGVFSNPYSVASDSSGNIYVADTYFNRIKKFDKNGKLILTVGSSLEFELPQGVSVNSMNMIFVSDTIHHRILKYNQLGKIVDQWGKMGSGDADFFTPAKCVVRTEGIKTFLYVVDPNNDRLQVFDISRFVDDINASEKYFSPNGDGIKDSTVISFALAGQANVDVDILSGNNKVADLFSGQMTEGYNYVSWEGRDAGGNTVADGKYAYRIVASSGSYTSAPFTGDIIADNTPPAFDLAIDHAAISPNGDSNNDSCEISYNVNDNLSDSLNGLKLQLFKVADSSNNILVYSFLSRERETIPSFGSVTWEGTLAGNLSEGRYITSMEGTDLAGNTTCKSVNILVDVTSPLVDAVGASPDPFSPNGDGIKDTTDIGLRLSDNLSNIFYVTVGVSSEDIPVRSLSSSELKGSGEQYFSWDGKNSSGEVMADGGYSYAVIVLDEAGNSSDVKGGIIKIDTVAPALSDVSISPTVFSPDNDGKDDTCTISFNLSEKSDVHIDFKDNIGNIYKSGDIGSLEAGAGSYTWNGKSDYQELKDGHYTFSVIAEDLAGNRSGPVSGDVYVNLTRYMVTAYASPDVTSNAAQNQVPVQIHYALARKATTVEAGIYDGATLKKTLKAASEQEMGQYVLTWAGDKDPGGSLESGSYTYKVTASDGSISSEAKGTVRIDNDPPGITDIALDTNEFNPTGIGNNLTTEVNLSYNLSENSYVKIGVYDSSEALVTSLIASSPQDFGKHSVKWNGDSGSGPVPEGEYAFRIKAVDEAGNERNESIKLTVKTASIALSDAYNSPNPLTPNSDGIDEFTKIYYTLSSGSAYITIKVRNFGGATVATLAENDLQGKGKHMIIWDGRKDEGGRPVADEGVYYYEITAKDDKGDTLSVVAGEMLLILNPTTAFAVSPEVFSPNGDGKDEYTSIVCNLNYSSYLTGDAYEYINIYDANNNPVYSYTEKHGRGIYTHKWYGINNQSGSEKVPDGTYNIQVQIVDPANITVTYTKSVRVDADTPVITIASSGFATPNPFSPNRDGVDESTVLNYSIYDISDIASKEVKIYASNSIFDNTTLVKDIDPGTNIWDGTVNYTGCPGDSNFNGYADPGKYYFRVVAVDSMGNSSEAVSPAITVRKEILEVKNIDDPSANPFPNPFSPDDDGHKDSTQIKYRISSHPEGSIGSLAVTDKKGAKRISGKDMTVYSSNPIAKVDIKVYDPAGGYIKTIASAESVAAGEYSKEWDGTYDNGLIKVPEGSYNIVVNAKNMIDEPADTVLTMDAIVDITAPYISGVIASPDAVSPNGDGVKDKSTINYNIGNDGHVVITIRYPGGAGNEILVDEDEVAGQHMVTWEPSASLAEGDYFYSIDAVDAAGNSTSGEGTSGTGSIIIDKSPPSNRSIIISGDAPYSSLETVSLAIHAEDVTGMDKMKLSCDKLTWTTEESYSAARNWLLGALEGTKEVYVMFLDNAGNWTIADVKDDIIYDKTPPSMIINSEFPAQFNPYVENAATMECALSDNYAAGASITTALYMTDGTTMIKSFSGYPGWKNVGTFRVTWDGTNDYDDYVNEGTYLFKMAATDPAGNCNALTKLITIEDDQQMTSLEGGSYSHDPNLSIISNQLLIRFATGESFGDKTILRYAEYDDYGATGLNFEFPFTITGGHETVNLYYWMFLDNWGGHLMKISDKNNSDSSPWRYKNHTSNGQTVTKPFYETITLPAGKYYAYVFACAPPQNNAGSGLQITYQEPKYNKEKSPVLSDLNNWITSVTLESISDILSASSLSGNIIHYIWASEYKGQLNSAQDYDTYYNVLSTFTSFGNNEIVYNKRTNGSLRGEGYLWGPQNYWSYWYPVESRITNAPGDSINPAIATDSTGYKVYVVWEDYRNGSGQVFYKMSTNEGNSWPPSPSGDILLTSEVNCSYPSIYSDSSGNNLYVAFAKDNAGHKEIYYMKGTNGGTSWTTPVRITRSEFSNCNAIRPSIVADSSGNAFVAWEDTRTGASEIWFQKIPSNFAPFSGSGMTTMSMPSQPVIAAPVTILSGLITPELISPINGSTVNSLRPTFKWYGVQGVRDYEIRCSTSSGEALLAGNPDYTQTIDESMAEKDRPLCEFTQSEHYMGLDESDMYRPYWYWKVQTANTTEVTTSEVGQFRIELPVSLSSVINWPNPFDPNKERTKIRYRLGREAENVTIRIYDITGALVRELDGTCNAEGSNIWNKYNDVEWDGRNGRGDMVLNGVYPFEVSVTCGNKTVTGRGKAVVLK